jgi:hypothetical protein
LRALRNYVLLKKKPRSKKIRSPAMPTPWKPADYSFGCPVRDVTACMPPVDGAGQI